MEAKDLEIGLLETLRTCMPLGKSLYCQLLVLRALTWRLSSLSSFNSWHLERPVCQTHWLCEVATILNPVLQMMELMPRELTWLVHSVTPVSGQQEEKPRPWGASAQARDHCDFQCLKKKKNSGRADLGRADLGIWEENFCSCKIVNGWEAKKNNFFSVYQWINSTCVNKT